MVGVGHLRGMEIRIGLRTRIDGNAVVTCKIQKKLAA